MHRGHGCAPTAALPDGSSVENKLREILWSAPLTPHREGRHVTLDTIPRYDPDRISRRDGHALVVGASMAGLLAARVLADGFETVTILEKDRLPAGANTRPGVPQSRHIHILHKSGQVTLDDLFPGYSEELTVAGGLEIDAAIDFDVYTEGDFLAKGPVRMPMYCASRPLFEHVTRQRVAALENVTIRDPCQFVGPVVDDGGSTVDGVAVRTGGDTREVEADLIVDATGRTSRTPAWLERNGYTPPRTDVVRIGVAYSTAILERAPGDRRALVVFPTPPNRRGCATFPIEGGKRVLTLAGYHGDHAPTDPEGFADFADSLPVPDAGEFLAERDFVADDIAFYPIPSNRRQRYEDLEEFPEGLVVVGDAIASFNPIYGQGMSVAALQAVQLHHTLAADDRDGIALRFFERAGSVVDDAWRISTGADFKYPETGGPKPFGTGITNRYLARLTRKAHTDWRLAEAFGRVAFMEKGAMTLFRPEIVWRVLKPGR